MNNRLLVNPGTPQAWEIQLKPGPNRIGRGEDNDFVINHPSISTHHAEITVSDDGILFRDLGSTNGSFLDRAPVREARLSSGQNLQLGAVALAIESDAPASAPTAVAAVAEVPVLAAVSSPAPAANPLRPAGLRLNLPKHEETETPPPMAGDQDGEEEEADAGNNVCRSHPKSPARFLCRQCNKYFCELCVTTRGTSRFCRGCGKPLTQLRVPAYRPIAERGFFSRLPGAFIYPFKGVGSLVLILATIAFLALDFISAGIFTLLFSMAVYGFVFLFMQNIIHTTVADEKEPLSFPSADGLFGAFFQLAGTILVSFGLPIGLFAAKAFGEVDIPPAAIIASMILGCFYFPMAFLAVAMKDTVMAANPMIVIPTILRIPLEYLVASILVVGVYGVRLLGNMASSLAGDVALSTRDMSTLMISLGVQGVWALISVYLLTVSMRILGLLYISRKHKFGWFAH